MSEQGQSDISHEKFKEDVKQRESSRINKYWYQSNYSKFVILLAMVNKFEPPKDEFEEFVLNQMKICGRHHFSNSHQNGITSFNMCWIKRSAIHDQNGRWWSFLDPREQVRLLKSYSGRELSINLKIGCAKVYQNENKKCFWLTLAQFMYTKSSPKGRCFIDKNDISQALKVSFERVLSNSCRIMILRSPDLPYESDLMWIYRSNAPNADIDSM